MSVISAQMASRFASIRSPEEEEKGTTIRKPASALLTVDSGDRYASVTAARAGTTSPYQFSISKSENILTGFVKRIALTEIVFPWYVPNINFRTNELFYISSIVGNGSITIGTGFYTPVALATTVQAALIADGVVGVTVTYVNGQFVVDAGAGNTIAFIPAASVPPGSKEADFQLFDLMGFSASNQAPAQFQYSDVTRCRYTEYIDIVCSQLVYNQDLKDQSSAPITRDCLARIYLECENDQPLPVSVAGAPTDVDSTIPGCYPFTIYRQFKSPKEIKWNAAQPVGNLTFEVYDDNGQLLTGFGLQDYKFPDWRMTLLCSEN
jgi:hypothetical protein